MRVLMSHPTGNANVRAAAVGLNKKGLLAGFYTTIATFTGSVSGRLSSIGALSELKRRQFDDELRSITKLFPWYEAGRLLASKFKLHYIVNPGNGFLGITAVYRSLDQKVASTLREKHYQGLDAVYAYEDGALFTFRKAKTLNIKCIYDLPIGYWKAAQCLLEQESYRWPEWRPTLLGLKDSDAKNQAKDEEIHLAELIIVASSFTAKTLEDYSGKIAPIRVIPYGFPPVFEARTYDNSIGRPLRLLFVGGLSQRKGLADLFAAVDQIGEKVILTIVGRKNAADCPALDQELAKHNWIPSLSHQEVLLLMRENDVLVFPSLFEGFGLVITEAMSQGTPVITTDRTAGPDLIRHNENGWLVEAGSVQALQNQIQELLENKERIKNAGTAAMKTAKLRPWSVYGAELADALSEA